ncbi:F-box protein At2g02240-like [Nymphaea colorata]|nr:F-box protein At2g02240-like [Nymphaea colorata]
MAVFQSVVLPPKSVWVCWADNSKYWKVSPMQNSRFSQKAELLEVCWLQIQGTFDTAILDKDTTYSLLFFFKHNDRASGLGNGAEVSLSQKDGKTICKRQVHLKPGSSDFIKQDGEEWLAIEAGTFQPTGITPEISFNLLDCSSNWKSGLVFAGVEIRAVST